MPAPPEQLQAVRVVAATSSHLLRSSLNRTQHRKGARRDPEEVVGFLWEFDRWARLYSTREWGFRSAIASAALRLWLRLAPAVWARCTARGTLSSAATSPSRYCGRKPQSVPKTCDVSSSRRAPPPA